MKDSPVFKKENRIVDGKEIESFFINDKEVDISTYYSMFDELLGIKKPTMTKKINKHRNYDTAYDYIRYVLDNINNAETIDDKHEYLANELLYQYYTGLHIGQRTIISDLSNILNKHDIELSNSLKNLQSKRTVN